MKFKIQIVLDDSDSQTPTEEIIQLEKSNDQGYCAGLSLQEAKQLLKIIQQKIVLHQAKTYTHSHRACPCCHKQRKIKGYHTIQYRTLFGTVVMPSLRLCQWVPGAIPSKMHTIPLYPMPHGGFSRFYPFENFRK